MKDRRGARTESGAIGSKRNLSSRTRSQPFAVLELSGARMKRKRTEITIETDRVFYISSPRVALGWCAQCETQVEMVTVDEAAILRRVNSRTMFQWVESQEVHARENGNGLLLICLNSLS